MSFGHLLHRDVAAAKETKDQAPLYPAMGRCLVAGADLNGDSAPLFETGREQRWLIYFFSNNTWPGL